MRLTIKLFVLAILVPASYLAATIAIPPSPDVPHEVAMPLGVQAVLLGLGILVASYAVLGALAVYFKERDDE